MNRQERGMTLVIALVMLVVLTLLATLLPARRAAGESMRKREGQAGDRNAGTVQDPR